MLEWITAHWQDVVNILAAILALALAITVVVPGGGKAGQALTSILEFLKKIGSKKELPPPSA